MVYQNYPQDQNVPQSMNSTWVPMNPQVNSPAEFEDQLVDNNLQKWIEQHPYFIPTIFTKLEELITATMFRIFVTSGIMDILTELTGWLSRQPGSKLNSADVLGKLSMMSNIGTPNTDANGVPLSITKSIDLSARGLHSEGIEHLQQAVENNHQVHVNNGWAYQDPTTQAYWTQYGISSPQGFDSQGAPTGYQFQPHQQYAPYGQPGQPGQPVHGSQSNKGSTAMSLLGLLM